MSKAMMLIALSAIVLLCCVNGSFEMSNIQEEFQQFVKRYNRTYVHDYSEYMYRFQIFKERWQFVHEHNSDKAKTWTAAINKFSDLTYSEFKKNYLGASGQDCSATGSRSQKRVRRLYRRFQQKPKSLDWRSKGIISQVEDQGQCGSCWTFSTTGLLEAHMALYGNKKELFSQQNLIDCAGKFNNFGCDGGLPSQALEYIRFNGGLDTLNSYPYRGVDGKCHFNRASVGVRVKAVHNISEGDEVELFDALATVGPISIAYDCSDAFMSYSEGVFSDPNCSKDSQHVNHAVLAVGYGTTRDGIDYYIVKNSWGADWGEKGFFRILRGTNECGLADCATYPTLSLRAISEHFGAQHSKVYNE